MGKLYPELDERLRKFISRQAVFFVATAPCLTEEGTGGHVNVSPKGYRDTFAVLGPHRVAYLDLTGSGAETIAHLRENGRITIMFCAFDGPPRIVRLFGTGKAVVASDATFAEFAANFPELQGARSVIVVDVDRIADSCGYAVPRMELVGDRDDLLRWADRKGPDGIVAYWQEKNAASIDGLPAVTL